MSIDRQKFRRRSLHFYLIAGDQESPGAGRGPSWRRKQVRHCFGWCRYCSEVELQRLAASVVFHPFSVFTATAWLING